MWGHVKICRCNNKRNLSNLMVLLVRAMEYLGECLYEYAHTKGAVFFIDLDAKQYQIRTSCNVPDLPFEIVLLELINKCSLARLLIELKPTIDGNIQKVPTSSLKEVLLYTHYFMRKYNLKKLMSCLSDTVNWHIFQCEMKDDNVLKIVGYCTNRSSTNVELLQYLTNLITYVVK